MIDKERLAQKCSTWNIVLSGAQLDLLDRYAEILVDYNQKVNLTAITSPEGIEDRHFADSLLFAAQPEVTGKLVDVGTGAGFPGVVAKIFKPDLQLTLMEPTGKRVDFLKYLCGELGLTGVEFAKERAEEAARKQWRESFDVATARAVATSKLSRHCLRAASSARSLANSTPVRPSSPHRYFKKSTRLPVGSIRVSCKSGLKIFATTPGNPAPVPTSTSLPVTSGWAANSRLSAKWRSSMPSGLVMAVRFTFWL